MQVDVQGGARPTPFLRARDTFATEFDLDRPVKVRVSQDPDQRTVVAHHADHHTLTISAAAATSGMARELAVHEYAHMYRNEERHPSHVQSTAEALFLALAGRSVERRKISHCYQIANHMKDIYADDLTLAVTPPTKLVAFLESELANAIADRPIRETPGRTRLTAAPDPEITAINAAFATGLLERHDLIEADHRIYTLAEVAAGDAPSIDTGRFKRRFRDLDAACDSSSYRRELVDMVRTYVDAGPAGPPAD